MTRHLYRGFGLLIESEFELPELPRAADTIQPDVVIRRGAVPRLAREATLDEELALHNPEAAFLIRHGREVIVDEHPDADPSGLRVLLLGRVMAFLFRQRGWLPLHASAVVIGNACALFLGYPRAGKSTTAAAFHRLGHLVVTDDVAPVRVDDNGNCVLQSGWSYVRLRPDAQVVLAETSAAAAFQAGKYRYDLNAFSEGKLYPTHCAYTIEFGDRLSVEPAGTVQAVPLLSRFSFIRHSRMARESLQAHLRDCSAVASAVPVRRLIRPRALAELPELVRFVEADLATLRTGIQR